MGWEPARGPMTYLTIGCVTFSGGHGSLVKNDRRSVAVAVGAFCDHTVKRCQMLIVCRDSSVCYRDVKATDQETKQCYKHIGRKYIMCLVSGIYPINIFSM